jgi:hypothetical protein
LRGGGDRAGLSHGNEVTDLTQGHHEAVPSKRFFRFYAVYIFFFDGRLSRNCRLLLRLHDP